jgi:gliding motility-associated-like protein
LTNAQEGTLGTDPTNPDTDGDGISDGIEVTNSSNPLNPCDPNDSSPDCQVDTDADGVTDAQEAVDGTSTTDPCSYVVASITLPITSGTDCDSDGLLDIDEIANGSNPFDPCDPNNAGIDCINGIYLPTGFSPNGNGPNMNETLEILVGQDVASFTLYIYDRWGNKMVQTSDKNFTWDGSYDGKPCNAGVYAYILDVKFVTGIEETRSGNITLIR